MGGIDWSRDDDILIEALLDRWRPLLASHQILVRIGDPLDVKWLDFRGAEAEFLPPDLTERQPGLILFRDHPSRSSLLEEVAHALQYIRDRFASSAHLGESMVSLLKEIEVAECLDAHAERFYIPPPQRTTTRTLLQRYRHDLQNAEARW